MKLSYSKYDVIAGEDLGDRKVVYLSNVDEAKLAKADSETTLPAIGFTDGSALNGETIRVVTNDLLDKFTSLVAGDSYYLSQVSAGEITNVKPSSGIIIRLGVAKSSTELDIHILKIETKENIGLGNVDNTSDLDKPISSATQTGLDGKSNTGHPHVESDITDLSHTDDNAVHDNVPGEINSITEKVTPVNADILIIEDSADSNNKKKLQIGNLPSGGSGAQKVQSMQLSTVNYPYLESAGAVYTLISQFIFLGTTKLGTPTKIKSITWRNGGDTVDIRIYDVTNSQIICEKTGIVDLVATVHDLGTLSNLPSGEAIFEIQHKANGSAAKCRTSNISVEW